MTPMMNDKFYRSLLNERYLKIVIFQICLYHVSQLLFCSKVELFIVFCNNHYNNVTVIYTTFLLLYKQSS